MPHMPSAGVGLNPHSARSFEARARRKQAFYWRAGLWWFEFSYEGEQNPPCMLPGYSWRHVYAHEGCGNACLQVYLCRLGPMRLSIKGQFSPPPPCGTALTQTPGFAWQDAHPAQPRHSLHGLAGWGAGPCLCACYSCHVVCALPCYGQWHAKHALSVGGHCSRLCTRHEWECY